jgi:hypothetical protein
MNERVGEARIGQWYQRHDKGELFVVTGRDASSGAIEIQSFDGDVDEIETNAWSALPLEFAEAPEDWSGPLDLDPEDVRYSETAMTTGDWNEPLQPIRETAESWEETTPEDERDPLAEGEPTEESLAANPAAAARVS